MNRKIILAGTEDILCVRNEFVLPVYLCFSYRLYIYNYQKQYGLGEALNEEDKKNIFFPSSYIKNYFLLNYVLSDRNCGDVRGL